MQQRACDVTVKQWQQQQPSEVENFRNHKRLNNEIQLQCNRFGDLYH